MSEEMLVRHCSPTLAGLKTANLVNCPCTSPEEFAANLAKLNRRLNPRGVNLRLLRWGKESALVYVYRPDKLCVDLCGEAWSLLGQEGYLHPDASSCLRCLSQKLRQEGTFPHEIGLFLGYPLEDVIGFIENHGQHCKCVGTWKVYSDEKAARKTFARYKKCTDVYERLYHEGYPLTRLTVQGKPVGKETV